MRGKQFIVIALIVTLGTAFNSFSQKVSDAEFKRVVKQNNETGLINMYAKLITDGDYIRASEASDYLLNKNAESANYNYRKGVSLMNSSDDLSNAIPYLEKAIQKISKNYDAFSAKELGAPVDAIYYLGRCYHGSEQIQKAESQYNNFIKATNRKDPLMDEAKLRLQQCNSARNLLSRPKDYAIVNMGATINSPYPDYSSAISPDGSTIYFTSIRPQSKSSRAVASYEDVYFSYRGVDGRWTEPEIMPFCKPNVNEAFIGMSSDERTIYIYKDDAGNGDIFFSQYKDNRYQTPRPILDKGVNTEFWEPHINYSFDGKIKFFVSDRPGGYGGRDIYMIEQDASGRWGDPVNLGPKINTEYEEDAPFIAYDNRTLYFSSNNPNSMGGFDIFKTVRQESGEWSTPENLGYPLNSTGDDIYFTTTLDGGTGYLTSWRPGGQGEKDIYEVKNMDRGTIQHLALKGSVSEQDGNRISENVYLLLDCLDCQSDDPFKIYPRIMDGSFVGSLSRCQEYKLSVFKDGRSVYTENFKTNCRNESEEIVKNIVIGQGLVAETREPEPVYEPEKVEQEEIAMVPETIPERETTPVKKSSSQDVKTFEYWESEAAREATPVKESKPVQESKPIVTETKPKPVTGTTPSRSTTTSGGELVFEYWESKTLKNNETSTPSTSSPSTTSRASSSGINKYDVVIGSFGVIENAEKMRQNAIANGFNDSYIIERNNFFTVSVKGSNSRNELESVLIRAKQTMTQNAWILTR